MRKKYGFSMIELVFVLIIIAVFLGIIAAVTSRLGRQHQNESLMLQILNLSQGGNRYLTTHYTLLQNKLSPTGHATKDVVTIPMETLIKEGFLAKSSIIKNYLGQVPCLVITWDGNELGGLLYYRATNGSRNLTLPQVYAGLNSIGDAAGYYSNGHVYGAASDWGFSNPADIFVAHGIDLSDGVNPNAYRCNGSAIAPNSYVINLAYMEQLNNRLPKADTLLAYKDDTTNTPDDPQNNNVMVTDLNMYFKGNINRFSSLIFQNNEKDDCMIDPNITNDLCTKHQLGIHVDPDYDIGDKAQNKTTPIVVTGFNKMTGTDDYVGQLAVATVQPLQSKNIGDKCTPKQLGALAKINVDSKGYPVGRDYNGEFYTYPVAIASNLVCQINVLCPNDTLQKKDEQWYYFCWLPSSTITYEVNLNLPAPAKFIAPAGFGIVPNSVEYTDVVFTPAVEAAVAGRWKENWWAIPRCTSDECMRATAGQQTCHESGNIIFDTWEAFGTWQPATAWGYDIFYFATNPDTSATKNPEAGYIKNNKSIIYGAYGKYRYWWRMWDGIGPTAGSHCTFWWGGGISRQPLIMTKVKLSNDPSIINVTVNVTE